MLSILTPIQADLRQALSAYISRTGMEPAKERRFCADVTHRLDDYAGRGKLIRGALVAFSQGPYRDSYDDAAIDTGVAMELLQTFLLIHDDIMDRDDTRRGAPSIHAQYEAVAPRVSGAHHYGLSQAISAGDVAAFLAIQRIATIGAPERVRLRLQEMISAEIIQVGLAQMQDVFHGYANDASEEEILDVYTYKTGRYTFSLPLMAGAVLARVAEEEVQKLADLGEGLGRVFQIRDDELGLFGDASDTGKPAGSDIEENKKTLFRAALFEYSRETERLTRLFGKKDLSIQDLQFVRSEVHRCGAYDVVEAAVDREAVRSQEIIDSLSIGNEARASLTALLDYNNQRSV